MKIDVSKTAVANLIALVNADNASANILASNVTVGTPTAAAGTAGRNTTVTLTSTALAPHDGAVTLSYTRQSLDHGVTTPNYTLILNQGDDQTAALAKIATQLGLVASEVEFSGTFPTYDVGGNIDLQPKTGSLLYVGAAHTIAVTWDKPDLSSLVTVTDLNGFEAA